MLVYIRYCILTIKLCLVELWKKCAQLLFEVRKILPYFEHEKSHAVHIDYKELSSQSWGGLCTGGQTGFGTFAFIWFCNAY